MSFNIAHFIQGKTLEYNLQKNGNESLKCLFAGCRNHQQIVTEAIFKLLLMGYSRREIMKSLVLAGIAILALIVAAVILFLVLTGWQCHVG